MDASPGVVILDAVFNEVKNNLIRVVLHREHIAAPVQVRRQLDLRPVGQRHEHPEHPAHRFAQIDHLMLASRLRVGLAERQELLRHAGQAV